MRSKDRAIDGFLKRAVEEICNNNFDEAEYLFEQARQINVATDYEFEMNYLKDIDV